MKNKKIRIFIIILISNLICFKSFGFDQFNFDVTEIEIKNNGNLIKGLKEGTITSNDGLKIEADQFEYEKSTNILNARGNVKIVDQIKDYEIFSENITYLKNLEKNYFIKKFKSSLRKK